MELGDSVGQPDPKMVVSVSANSPVVGVGTGDPSNVMEYDPVP